MSNQKAEDARLQGFEGPFFEGLEGTQQKLYREFHRHPNDVFAGTLVDQLPNGTSFKRLVATSDEYLWTFGIHFKAYGVECVLLLPSTRDNNVDGTWSERHMALYCYSTAGLGKRRIQRIGEMIAVAYGH